MPIMKKIIFLLTLFSCYIAFCQGVETNTFNFDLENQTAGEDLPDNWFTWGKGDYIVKIDNAIVQKGKTSLSITSPEKKESFGCAVIKVPADYSGEVIELKGYIKTEDVKDGYAGLIMRIDGKDGVLEFDNMRNNGIKGTTGWKQYSIQLPLPSKAKSIYIGAIHTGTGKIWADNFEIYIDDTNILIAKPTQKVLSKAEMDTEFNKGSNITSVPLDAKSIKNIELLGKVWGYLKYYHPAVATNNLNWDYELFRVMPKILNAKTEQQRDEVLLTWVTSLGDFKVKTQKPLPANQVKFNPDFGWIDALGNAQLKAQLYKIKDAERTDENEYVSFAPSVRNTLYDNENSYAEMTYPDAGFRLLSLYRYWNIINYFFPYKNLIGEDWNNVLTEFIPKFVNVKNETEYQLVCLEIIARIHDTHANMWASYDGVNKFWGVNHAPVAITFTEGQPVVTDFLDNELGPKTGLQKGDVITSINNKPISDIIKNSLKYLPASNYETQLRDLSAKILSSNDNTLHITYLRGKEKREATINAYSQDKIDIYKAYREKAKDTCFKMLSPKIAYLYPGTIKSSYLPEIMEAAKNTDALIIDLRCYPSDFIVFSLGEYLMPKSTPFVKFTTTDLLNPGAFTYKETLSVGDTNNDTYKGKIIILVNETTQSQAEYTTMAFRVAPNAMVIGSVTAGADGNLSRFTLPGNIKTAMSGIGVYYPDGKETQRVGIVPDITIKPSIEGVRQNKDEILDKAIAIINTK